MRNNVIDTINQYQIAQMILSNLSDSLACIKDAIDNLSLRHMHDSEVVKKEASDFLSGVKKISELPKDESLGFPFQRVMTYKIRKI
jgi:hypothetical protein